MKNFLASMMIAVTAMSMVAEATARPLGGGRSIGRQSSNVARQAPAPAPATPRQATPAPAAPATPAPAVQPKPASPWKGIIGGALLGLGLGALLSHFGLGGALASAIGTMLTFALIAGAIFLIWRFFRNRSGAGQARRDGVADAARGTGDNGGLAFQIDLHAESFREEWLVVHPSPKR